MRFLGIFILASIWVLIGSCSGQALPSEVSKNPGAPPEYQTTNMKQIPATEEEWKLKLNHEQYQVLRQKGTERPFSGKYWDHHESGEYSCAGCGAVLFTSDDKFDSGCGWPSFFTADTNVLKTQVDRSFGMIRTEVMCKRCGGHLGHLFDDGPAPTGLRYCINSVSLDFLPSSRKEGK